MVCTKFIRGVVTEIFLREKDLLEALVDIGDRALKFPVVTPAPFEHIVVIVVVGSKAMLHPQLPLTDIEDLVTRTLSGICESPEAVKLPISEMSLIPDKPILGMIVSAEAVGHIIYTGAFIPHARLLGAVRIVLEILSTEACPARVNELAFKHDLARSVIFAAHASLHPVPVLSLIHKISTRVEKATL